MMRCVSQPWRKFLAFSGVALFGCWLLPAVAEKDVATNSAIVSSVSAACSPGEKPCGAAPLELVLATDSSPLELPLNSATANTLVSAKAKLWQSAEALFVQIEVRDPQMIFAADAAQGDHIRIWLAPPANRYSDQPQHIFFSKFLGERYWLPAEAIAALTTENWSDDESKFLVSDFCFDEDELPELLLTPAPVALGVRRIDINPYGQQLSLYQGGAEEPQPEPADALQLKQFELDDGGYAITLRLSPAALGLVTVTGVASQRLAIDLVDFDDQGMRRVFTSALRSQEDEAAAFNTLHFTQPLQIAVDERLPFIGRSWQSLTAWQQPLTAVTPPYLLWDGTQWVGARLGQRPGTARGYSPCTSSIAEGLLPFESALVSEAFNYQRYEVAGRRIERYQGTIFIDSKPLAPDLLGIDRPNEFDDGSDMYRPQLLGAFAVDADTVALVTQRSINELGRFSQGPCASSVAELLDLLLWSESGSVRLPLVENSGCHGASIDNEQLDEGELNSWYEEEPTPLAVDANSRTVVIKGARNDYQWRVVKGEEGWLLERQVIADPLAITRLFDELEASPPPAAAELATRLLATAKTKQTANLEEVDKALCYLTSRMSLRSLSRIVGQWGKTPECLVSPPLLAELIAPQRPGIMWRWLSVGRLVASWQPDQRYESTAAESYLALAQQLETAGQPLDAEVAYALAGLLADRRGSYKVQRRHIDTNVESSEGRLLGSASARIWTFVLDHSVDASATDSLVEYWLAEYAKRGDQQRFDALMARHPLPADSYRYLLLFTAKHPHLHESLLARGVRFDDRLTNGDTLLHLLVKASYSKPEQLRLLVKEGVAIDAADAEGQTPLQRLYSRNNSFYFYEGQAERFMELAQTLIDAGAEVNHPGLLQQALLLDSQYYGRRVPSLFFSAPLLAAGADLEQIDEHGDSALRLAARNGERSLLAPLVAAGAHIDSSDASGRTALMLAIAGGWINSANTLLAAGADPQRRDHDGHNGCDYLQMQADPKKSDPAAHYALRKQLGCL